jgi:DNA transposition AAA+ family ATPase
MTMDENHDKPMIRGMEGQSRVLIQARMLPMTKLMEEQISGVRTDFIRYTSKTGVFDAQVAKELDLSSSVISQWRRDNYQGDSEAVARAVNDWMERHARRANTKRPAEYVPTQVAKDMRTICQAAIDMTSMAAVIMPAGSGKTMVLKALQDETRGAYVYCDEDLTPRSFLVAVAKAVDSRTGGSLTSAGVKDLIIERMRGTNRPLILDEAHRLRPEVFPRIRSIHDQAEIPIIMAGTHQILHLIDDRGNGRGQMASRTLVYNALDHVYNAEDPSGRKAGRALFSRDEVKALFASMKIKLASDAFELMWGVSCLPNRGCLRTVQKVVQLCTKRWAEEEITRQRALQALQLLFGFEGRFIADHAIKHAQQMRKFA